MQHCRARVVAVDRLLDLIVHGNRNVLGEIGRDPFRAVGSCGNHQLILVVRVECAVEEVHDRILSK